MRMTVILSAILLMPDLASACDQAELLRLAEEQKKLAARNAWTGVERSYVSLKETRCELNFDHYFLGAEAARYLGKTWEQHERLQRAQQIEPRPEITESIEAIEASYGRVDLRGDPRRRPVLWREEMPFAPDQRKSIGYAQTYVAETGSFYGMLPAGEYEVGDLSFTVEAGQAFEIITVGKVRRSDVASPSGLPDPSAPVSFLRYANLVITLGPSFLSTPESKKEVVLQDGGHQFAPSDVFVSGFSLQVGGELGLTYEEPALGVATTLGYVGGYGTDTLHGIQAWVAGVARPGNLRLALGPQYQVVMGSGTGVASWFDRGHDQSANPNDSLLYSGFAWGPGLQGSIGLGLLDFDAFQGVVELGGSWQSDGARGYYSFGLRVGIVPTVPRFSG